MRFHFFVFLVIVITSPTQANVVKDQYHAVYSIKSTYDLFRNGIHVYKSNATATSFQFPNYMKCYAITGAFDIGKTWFINTVIEVDLPSGKSFSTVGLSVYFVQLSDLSWVAVIDVAGSGFRADPEVQRDIKATDNVLFDAVVHLGCQIVTVIDKVSSEALELLADYENRILQIRNIVENKNSVNPLPVTTKMLSVLNARNVEHDYELVEDVNSFVFESMFQPSACGVNVDEKDGAMTNDLIRKTYAMTHRYVGLHKIENYRVVFAKGGSPVGIPLNHFSTCIAKEFLTKGVTILEGATFEDRLVESILWATSQSTNTTLKPLHAAIVRDPDECLPINKGGSAPTPRSGLGGMWSKVNDVWSNLVGRIRMTAPRSGPCHRYSHTLQPTINNESVLLLPWRPRWDMYTVATTENITVTIVEIQASGCQLSRNAEVVLAPTMFGNEVRFDCRTKHRKASGIHNHTVQLTIANVHPAFKVCLHEVADISGQILIPYVKSQEQCGRLSSLCDNYNIGCSVHYVRLYLVGKFIIVYSMLVWIVYGVARHVHLPWKSYILLALFIVCLVLAWYDVLTERHLKFLIELGGDLGMPRWAQATVKRVSGEL